MAVASRWDSRRPGAGAPLRTQVGCRSIASNRATIDPLRGRSGNSNTGVLGEGSHEGDPTLADGLRAADRHLPSILGYSLIAASVGLILNALQERSRKIILGRIAVGMLGMAWTLISFLVVPVLVLEGVGPVAAIQRSTQLLTQTWGEQIASTFGFGAIGFLFSLVGVLMVLAGLYAAVALNAGPVALLSAGAAAVLYRIVVAIVLSALRASPPQRCMPTLRARRSACVHSRSN